jgi:hypothetical protein
MLRRFAAGLAAAVCVLLSGAAAQAEGEWQFLLQFQLALDERCQIEYVTNLHEAEVGGVATVSGRAVCTDGRAFDFARLHPLEAFDIKICEIESC